MFCFELSASAADVAEPSIIMNRIRCGCHGMPFPGLPRCFRASTRQSHSSPRRGKRIPGGGHPPHAFNIFMRFNATRDDASILYFFCFRHTQHARACLNDQALGSVPPPWTFDLSVWKPSAGRRPRCPTTLAILREYFLMLPCLKRVETRRPCPVECTMRFRGVTGCDSAARPVA